MPCEEYKPDVCPHCGQAETYIIGLDQGSVDILRALYFAVIRKGLNNVHLRNECETGRVGLDYETMIHEGMMTSNMVGNASRPRFHGLIAHVDGEPGHYCLTNKGMKFLRGEPVPRHAIISKVEGHNIGYWHPEDTVRITDFKGQGVYWGWDVVGGAIVRAPHQTIQQMAFV